MTKKELDILENGFKSIIKCIEKSVFENCQKYESSSINGKELWNMWKIIRNDMLQETFGMLENLRSAQ